MTEMLIAPEDRCVICGAYVSEGSMICHECEKKLEVEELPKQEGEKPLHHGWHLHTHIRPQAMKGHKEGQKER